MTSIQIPIPATLKVLLQGKDSDKLSAALRTKEESTFKTHDGQIITVMPVGVYNEKLRNMSEAALVEVNHVQSRRPSRPS